MEFLKKLDVVLTELTETLYVSSPVGNWDSQTFVATYTPDASVHGYQYKYVGSDGKVEEGLPPLLQYEDLIERLSLQHWQLTQDLGQPRWYKMIVTVQRSGKFNVEFEYKDDYQEGDIMQRG